MNELFMVHTLSAMTYFICTVCCVGDIEAASEDDEDDEDGEDDEGDKEAATPKAKTKTRRRGAYHHSSHESCSLFVFQLVMSYVYIFLVHNCIN